MATFTSTADPKISMYFWLTRKERIATMTISISLLHICVDCDDSVSGCKKRKKRTAHPKISTRSKLKVGRVGGDPYHKASSSIPIVP